jgi:integrase/recombinase XerD
MGRKVWFSAVSGPLSAYAAGYGAWLRTRSYSRSAISDRLWQFDQLSRWLDREGLAVGELSVAECERFAASRRATGRVTLAAPQSVLLPLEYLRTLGLTPEPVSPLAHGPVEELLADYSRYLLIERALTRHTVCDAYLPAARLFLAGRDGPGGLRLDRLAAADVSMLLACECPKRSVSGARDLVSALRSFLRYLHLVGWIEAPLVWALPSIADLRDRTLPRGLEPTAVKRLLASCDRRRLVGRRDFAILLLLSRLGLRAGEVAGLHLDDVDWRRGLLLVVGKGGRFDELPLPDDVGRALVSYLRRRPRCQSRAVFVRVTAPRRELNRSTIGWVVRAACDRAGLPRVGAHRLRHTAATEMLRRGASLAEIGEVLRHREQKTTVIYAKVDRTALRPLARPWPTTRAGAA